VVAMTWKAGSALGTGVVAGATGGEAAARRVAGVCRWGGRGAGRGATTVTSGSVAAV
jgi:hypothetical protein